ncbi:type II secretion system F family protein [Mangrovibrevibacter kandeliae]|uniref:type II secretion system F family protein n=1 Tax=Mangrovibrevibacter kandeliae TaxID=2968473 RepID=UPI0021187832|nr:MULTISPECIES: type II secretion system F family protein [unclassified Aurantimonas]MCQ8784106.1 type II secretion system F family protein [Aurantimonas sp. CSK15Z-1]MCW4116825.1 type II secretion system F family protein [Aurantimonas sp. MSK8Z-1]
MLPSALAALEPQRLVSLFAALACIGAALIVAWPYLGRDRLTERMRQLDAERERIRVRERAGLDRAKEQFLLREPPKKLYQVIVERFNMAGQVEDTETAQLLRRAGYRGRSPVVRYLAARVIVPGVFLVASTIYTVGILGGQISLLPKLVAILAATAFGYYLPVILLANRTKKRQTSIRRAWPEALDLMLICVESGMSIEAAFRRVSEEIGVQSPELAEELVLTTAELSYLQDRRKAFENLSTRTGLDGVKGVVTSLIQAERYGTPIGQALRVLAQENRDQRMAEAEKKAAALPPKLTVPMIVFFLPVLFAVVITPAVIQVMHSQHH